MRCNRMQNVWLYIRSVGYLNLVTLKYVDRVEKTAENSRKSETNIEIEREIQKQKREVVVVVGTRNGRVIKKRRQRWRHDARVTINKRLRG